MQTSPGVHPAWARAPVWVRVLIASVPALTVAPPLVSASGQVPLFRDEAATVQLATLALPQLLSATDHVDRILLPHLLVMKGWIAMAGDSTVALRVPSVLATVCLVAVVAVLGGRLGGPVGGAVAGLVVGVAPLTGTIAILARPYALVSLVAVLALLVLHLALEHDGPKPWVIHAVLVAASLLLQPFAVLALPAHVALAATSRTRRRWRRLTTAWAGAGGLALLMAVSARGQQGQVGWISDIGPQAMAEMVLGLQHESAAWLGVVGFLVGLALVVARRWAPWWGVGTALVLGPPLLLGLVSALLQPAFFPRYLFLVPTGVALLVGGLAGAAADVVAGRASAAQTGPRGSWRRPVSALLLAAAVVAAGLLPLRVEVRPVGEGVTTTKWSVDPPSALAEAVGEVLEPGDLLVIEQRLGWGGYAGVLARAWGDDALAAELDRRAVSGDLADITRSITSVGPPRTSDPAVAASGSAAVPPTGEPVRVVLLSLRSTAAYRFLEAVDGQCTAGPRTRDRRLSDTRLWVVSCQSAPAGTALSAVADHPSR
jgi:hypothetical protein